MACKVSSFFTGAFFFVMFGLMSVHFASMKTPAQDRSIASSHAYAKPWYDASWKL